MSYKNLDTDWNRRLASESARWVQDGLLAAEQREAILRLYPSEEAGRKDRAVLIFTILGSLLVGAGVILYVAANWPVMPAAVKVALIILAMALAYGAGYHFQYGRGGLPRLGQALTFLGSLFFGAGILLIGQIFHFERDYPLGVLAWALGLLPLVWVTNSRLQLYLATVLLGIWTIGTQTESFSYNYLFPVLLLGLIFPLARRNRSVLVEAAVLVGLMGWLFINLGRGPADGGNPYAPLVGGRLMILYGPAVLLAGFARLGDPRAWVGVGTAWSLLGTYLLTFRGPRWYPPANLPPMPVPFGNWPFLTVSFVVMLALLAVGVGLYWRKGEGRNLSLLLPALVAAVAAVSVQFLPEVPRIIGFNILLFTAEIAVVGLGIRRRMELLVNLGLIAFLIHLVTRYFDIFFTAMDRSFFFIFGGLLLLVGGWFLERSRRRWVESMGGAGDAE